MAIMILGDPTDEHAAHMHELLHTKNLNPFYFDTSLFPAQLNMSITPLGTGRIKDKPQNLDVSLGDIQAVYWRSLNPIDNRNAGDPFLAQMAYRETESALSMMFMSLDHCHWVNGLAAVEMHRNKGYQLKLLKDAGIRVPDTLISNDPDEIRAFFEAQNQKAIYKPVRGGGHTHKLTEADFTKERLDELKKAPVQFQEMIPGVDVRVYYFKTKTPTAFGAEIQSTTLDFRDDPNAPIVPIELPDNVIQDCGKLADLFLLNFTGIDIRRTPDGEYVFIEGNPSPMFKVFEARSGYPVAQTLLNTILGK